MNTATARLMIILTTAFLTACGSQANRPVATPTNRPASSTLPEPSASSAGLFAVLETRRSGVPSWNHETPDTIVIAGPDGYARAKATFNFRSLPQVPMAVPVLQPQAYVAAGAVYFIDAGGTVSRLDPSGSVRRITTFPVNSAQQAVSFAVSPDGTQVMAALFTYPSVVPGPSGGPPFMANGPSKLDLELASEGTARLLAHWEGQPTQGNPSGPTFHNITMAGWDSAGPIALIDGYVAIQNQPIEGQRWFGGHLARVGLDGTFGPSLTPDCDPYSIDHSGMVICTVTTGSSTSPEVRVLTASGQLVWKANPSLGPGASFGGFALSLDGQHLAMDGSVASRGGSIGALPSNFATRGWLDNQTIIGFIGGSNTSRIGVVRLSAPTRVEDWSFTADFVGHI